MKPCGHGKRRAIDERERTWLERLLEACESGLTRLDNAGVGPHHIRDGLERLRDRLNNELRAAERQESDVT